MCRSSAAITLSVERIEVARSEKLPQDSPFTRNFVKAWYFTKEEDSTNEHVEFPRVYGNLKNFKNVNRSLILSSILKLFMNFLLLFFLLFYVHHPFDF